MKRTSLVQFAHKVGREPSSRGKETTFSSILLPCRAPMSIPKHPDIKRFTAESILDTLEADLNELRERANKREEKKKSEKQGN